MEFMIFLTEQWMLVGLLAVLATTLFVVEGKRSGETLTHHQVTQLVNKGDAVIIDVRDSKEYTKGHIVDAINIPHQKLAKQVATIEKHKSKTLVIVDKMGQHAGASGKLLKEQGFTVNRLQGGMAEWEGQNLPLVKG